MEIQSRVNLEYDLRLFPYGRELLERIERLGESSFSKDFHLVVRKTGLAGNSRTTERIVNPSFNLLILTIAISGSPEAVLRRTRLTLQDGTTGRFYWEMASAPLAGAVLGKAPLWGIPILNLKGRALDLTIENASATTLDLLEIVFRGVKF